MEYRYGNSKHFNMIDEIFRRTPKVPLTITTTTVDSVILANIPDLFHFSVYRVSGNLTFGFIYAANQRTIDAICTNDRTTLEHFNYVVCEYLPEYWSHSMPKEDKDEFIHALQNLYATTAASSGELTKAIRS